jgi:hypothetical protein
MSSTTTSLTATTDNPRGIPMAVFLVRSLFNLLLPHSRLSLMPLGSQEDVQDFVGGPEGDAELALKSLQETLASVLPSFLPFNDNDELTL